MDKSLILVIFFVFGLFMGRVSALLAELFSILISRWIAEDANKTPQSTDSPSPQGPQGPQEPQPPANAEEGPQLQLWPFIVKCQRAWGWMFCSYPYKRLKLSLTAKGEKNQSQGGQMKTPHGGGTLPVRPFILEILMGLLFALLFHYVGWKYLLIEYLLFAFALTTASAVDWEHMILPDSLTLSGILIGLLGALLNPEAGREFLPALGGMLMGGGFLWIIATLYENFKKEEGLGGGDIKLLAWIGAVLTWKAVPFVILLSCFTGLLAAFVMFLTNRTSQHYFKQSIPFGPYLAFSALVYIFWGQDLARLYLSWFFYP